MAEEIKGVAWCNVWMTSDCFWLGYSEIQLANSPILQQCKLVGPVHCRLLYFPRVGEDIMVLSWIQRQILGMRICPVI
jgi:hypothetical protein